MIPRNILLISLLAVFLFAALYFFGFICSFKKFSGSESWKLIKEYELKSSKQMIERKINTLITVNPELKLEEYSEEGFKGRGWFSIIIPTPEDTAEYLFKFVGDSLQWYHESTCSIRLMHITTKEYDLSSVNFKKIKKNISNSLLLNFENNFIVPLKN